jgi:serine/threonine protein kinase
MYAYKNRSGKLRLANSAQMKNSFMSANVLRPNFRVVKGEVHIGSGTYGNVYAGYKNKTMRNVTALKKLKGSDKTDKEVGITRKIYKIVPRHVVNILRYSKSSIELEMYRGGALGDWLKKVKGMNDAVLRVIILQVVTTLYRIHQKDPSFRHNDLSLGNIFVDDRYIRDRGETLHSYKVPPIGIRTVLADFGLAADLQYPLRQDWPEYGIYMGNDDMYDVHMFLNNLLVFYAKKRQAQIPLTVKFLEDVLKGGYSGESNTYVRRYRLKQGAKLPYDFLMILNHFYFSVPLLNVKRIPHKNSRSTKLKMYKLSNTNIRTWGGNYEPIEAPLYSFVLKNLAGNGAPPSPTLRRNSKLSPILESGLGITHPYRAWSPAYRKRPAVYKAAKRSPLPARRTRSKLPTPPKKAPITGYRKKKPLPIRKVPVVRNLEANIKDFLKNKDFETVTRKNIRVHLDKKYSNLPNLKERIKNIVEKKILPLHKPLSPLTPIPISQRVKTFQKDKTRFYPEKVRKYLKNTGEYTNENIDSYMKKGKYTTERSNLVKFIASQGVKIIPADAPPPTSGTRTSISPGGRLRIGSKLC